MMMMMMMRMMMMMMMMTMTMMMMMLMRMMMMMVMMMMLMMMMAVVMIVAIDGAGADHAGDDDGAFASVMQVLEGIRNALAADAREWLARYFLTRIVPSQHARKGVRTISTCARAKS
eukprot:7099497-Pyramimonas_sp.AAC.1